MNAAEARAVVDAYRARKEKAKPADFMRYWSARHALQEAGLDTLTPGKRGFIEASRRHVLDAEAVE